MLKLSIVTINYNDAAGLKKTIDSVASQQLTDLAMDFQLEHILVDGGSTDGSVDVIKDYESRIAHHQLPISLKWVSEKDKGIYNAMNKGIEIAMGRRVVDTFNHSELVSEKSHVMPIGNGFILILNSADCLAAPDVLSRMVGLLDEETDILLANIIHVWPEKRFERSRKRQKSNTIPYVMTPTLLNFYHGTIPHDAALIRQSVYDTYGYYDEKMKICSDWKLFLYAMVMGVDGVSPLANGHVKYVDIDMVLFDMTGTSNQNIDKWQLEKRPELEQCVPARILADYDAYYNDICLMQRIHRHSCAYRVVWFIERALFKMEKWFK